MVNYAYNGDDQRVGQGSGGALAGELYAGASAGSPLLQNGEGTYTPGVSQHGSGGSAYFAADALGSTRGITGSTGAATDSLVYDAFGETLSRSGSTATPVQFAGTSGYQADTATGLLLLGHRYYDASVGRFLSSDPAQAGSNWYAYCDNNPLVRVDPTGHNKRFVISLPSDPSELPGFTRINHGKDGDDMYQRWICGDDFNIGLEFHVGVPGLPGERGHDHYHWIIRAPIDGPDVPPAEKAHYKKQRVHMRPGSTVESPEYPDPSPPDVADPGPPPSPYAGTDPSGDPNGGGAPLSDGPIPFPDQGNEEQF